MKLSEQLYHYPLRDNSTQTQYSNYPLLENSTQTQFYDNPLRENFPQTAFLNVIDVSTQTQVSANILTEHRNIDGNIQSAGRSNSNQKKITKGKLFLYSINEYVNVFNRRKNNANLLMGK